MTANQAAHWWEKEPWRMVQTNFREIDMEDIDAESYVKELQAFNATVALINTGGIVASYDTRVEDHPRSEYLHGDSLKKIMDARRAAIDADYEQAAAARAEAEENRLNYEAAMAAAEQTSGQIIADATRMAEHRSNEIVAEAREKATELRRQAEADAILERKKAEDDIKREIADVSTQLTGKLLQREINEEDHRALIDSFLQEIATDDDNK